MTTNDTPSRREQEKINHDLKTLKPPFNQWRKLGKIELLKVMEGVANLVETLRNNKIEVTVLVFPEMLSSLTDLVELCITQWSLAPDLIDKIAKQNPSELSKNLKMLQSIIEGELVGSSIFLNPENNFLEKTPNQAWSIYQVLQHLIPVYKSILMMDKQITNGDNRGYREFLVWIFEDSDKIALPIHLFRAINGNQSPVLLHLKSTPNTLPEDDIQEWNMLIVKYPIIYQALINFEHITLELDPLYIMIPETFEQRTFTEIQLTQNYIFVILRIYNDTISFMQDALELDQKSNQFLLKADLDEPTAIKAYRYARYFELKIQTPDFITENQTKNYRFTNRLDQARIKLESRLYMTPDEDIITGQLPRNDSQAITRTITKILRENTASNLI